MENKKKLDPRKILCLVGIITGVIFTICGLGDAMYKPDLSLYTFGSDYYTETYKAAYQTFLAVRTNVQVLGACEAAFGLFEICFFGIKLTELSAKSNKSPQSNDA